MTGYLSFDHAVLVVNDLQSATREFEELGFTVTPGGTHAGGLTHNALIGLADGTYLELVAPTRRHLISRLKLIRLTSTWQLYPPTRSSMGKRFLGLISAGPGLGDFALRTQQIETALEEVQARGLAIDNPVPGSRMRPDGTQVSWRSSVPLTTDMPFLIQDVTPLALRLPAEISRHHENEVLGIGAIAVEVADLERSKTRYQALLGVEHTPLVENRSQGSQVVVFPLGESKTIELLHSPQPWPRSHKYLASCQGRPIKITLTARGGERLSLEHDPQTGYKLSAST
jgi:Glyoxalase-like domain